MVELPVNEPMETRIEEPPGSLEELATAGSIEQVKDVAGLYPECLTAWAVLGEDAMNRDAAVEAYAYFRVGYHRGLDRLRKSGWRGSGTTPWDHVPNRGFLRSLRGLGLAAGVIGETEEADRCSDFFKQLAPDAPKD